MKTIGNFFWFILGGIITGFLWAFFGVCWCITIIGIPIGKQCFKFAKLSFFPFGKEVILGGGAGSLLLNIIWLLVTGVPMAGTFVVLGLLYCVTIIGIPFGKQCFKLAKLSLFPFGSSIVESE